MRRSKRIRKYPHWYDPVFGAAREWNNDDVASIVYIIKDEYLNSNVYTDDILSLLAMWDTEDCMDVPSTFHTRKSYVINSQIHDPDTPTYTEDLSGEH